MNKSVLVVYVLMLISLLSCDVDNINELMSKTREKFVDKKEDKKDLGVIDKTQEGIKKQGNVIQKNLKKREKQVLQTISIESVNVDNREVILGSQKEIEIKEEELVPSTEEEKAVQHAIEQVKNVFRCSEFGKLTEEQLRSRRIEYEKLISRFYNLFSELQNIRESYFRNNEDKKNRLKNHKTLIQLHNKLNDQRFNLEKLMNQVDSGFNDLNSAKYSLNRSQETLKKAIAERVKNKKRRNYWSRKKLDSDLLARQARNEAENALSQLESSSIKLIEVMEEKKEIAALLQEARLILDRFKI